MARLLSIGNPALYDMERRDIGDLAELGLWLLLGRPAEQARAMVGTSPFKVTAVDQHGVVERLARFH